MCSVARVTCSSRKVHSAPPHHGRNFGYFFTSPTRSNMRCAEYATSTDLSTCAILERTSYDGRGPILGTIRYRAPPHNAMSIAQNKKAFHDYFVEQKFEAGIELQGWEVKS